MRPGPARPKDDAVPTAGLAWPKDDAVLTALNTDDTLEPILNPILHYVEAERPEGPPATSYMSFAPKVLVRAFWSRERQEALGAVLFSADAADGFSVPAACHGAVAAIFDNCKYVAHATIRASMHARKQTKACVRSSPNRRARAHTRTHARTHRHTPIHTHTLAHTHTHTHTRTHTHARARAHAYTRACTRAHARRH
jgi:hypothetical protein